MHYEVKRFQILLNVFFVDENFNRMINYICLLALL